ncbi:MAG: PAS domain S-box protein [Nitratireductor sp.]|nr:PAS domain S-box protein [Nitratireductor sp.]MCC0020988.1 PAS domain S-box protein [Nitratireductor sp.]
MQQYPHKPESQNMGSMLPETPLPGGGEDAWIEVIRKMDEVYADLVRSQDALEQQNVRLEEAHLFINSVLQSMTDVLIVCDPERRIQQVNRALETLTGSREADLVGRQIESLFEEKSRGPFNALSHTGRPAACTLSDCEMALVSSDGSHALLSMNCAERRDHRGKLAGFVMIGRPVGELRRAYEKLDEAHKQLTATQQQLVVSEKMAALGRLVAGVAHELNNPISFVFGNMHVLKRYASALTRFFSSPLVAAREDEFAELKRELKIDRVIRDMPELIEGSLEGAERVSDIVKDLLRFSSTQEEQPEVFDVIKLVRTAADWVIKGERHKPQLVIEAPERLDIEGRKGHLHQIVVNLVQNAADVLAGQADGRITISVERSGTLAILTVSDNGTGIPEDKIDKIFEPFFTTKPIGQGTGLGLYVSYSMAQKNGGDLSAANRPDGGAAFTLRIPYNEHARRQS